MAEPNEDDDKTSSEQKDVEQQAEENWLISFKFRHREKRENLTLPKAAESFRFRFYYSSAVMWA